MGKVELRRTRIIEYLKSHGSVERKELWTNFVISETRLCEDLKALQINGYQFDTSNPGYVSLIEGKAEHTTAMVYESITTPIIRKWILIAWISLCSELRIDEFTGKNVHMGQTSVYKSLCKFYNYIYEKDDEKKYQYLLNTFHRDVRESVNAYELSHDLMHIFKEFEEKDLFRLSTKPFLVVFTKDLAEKYLFALNELDQNNKTVQSLKNKILFVYYNITPSDSAVFPGNNPKITNVYDRISIITAFTSLKKTCNNIDFISASTGIPVEQIQNDLITLKKNNIGRRLFGKNGFRTSAFLKNLSPMSNLAEIYDNVKDLCIFYLPTDEYTLFKEIRTLSFISKEYCIYSSTNIRNFGGNNSWHSRVDDLWYEIND